ncbi:hypothetical protein HK405_013990 [Cladochytrium tenue]|nr:hypothetical protein HK405_013990 [Cladochytrium tenue]
MLPHTPAGAGASAGPDPLHRHYRRRAPPVPNIAVDSNIAASWTVPGPASASTAAGPDDAISAAVPVTAGTSTDRAVRTTLVRTAATSGPGRRAAAALASQQRRFHSVKDSLYVLPSDGIEMNRQKLLHHVLRVLFQGIFHAPQEALFEVGGEHVRVLDMACGSAIWTREMAATFPRTNFVGADMDPESHTRDPADPPNLTFVTDDVLRGTSFRAAFTARNVDVEAVGHLADFVREAGLEVVKETTVSLPIGWNGPIGNMGRVNFESGTLAMKSFMAPALSMSEADFEKFFKDVLDECGAPYVLLSPYSVVFLLT